MKRIITLTILCFLANAVFSSNDYRLTKELNKPREGDRLEKYLLPELSQILIGNDCLWDFSDLEVYSTKIKTRYLSRGTDKPLIKVENKEQYYYSGEDTLYVLREISPNRSINFYIAKPVLSYPMEYGSKISGYFYGEGISDYSRYLRRVGKSDIEIVGMGRMITAENDSLRHVLLLKETSYSSILISDNFTMSLSNTNDSSSMHIDAIENSLRNDSITNKMETYKWFARGYRYPIMELCKIKTYYNRIAVDSVSKTYYVSPHFQKYELNEDTENDRLRQKENEEAFDRQFNEMSIPNTTRQLKSHNQSRVMSDLGKDNIAGELSVDAWCELYPLVVDKTTTLTYFTSSSATIEVKIYTSSGVLMWQHSMSHVNGTGNIDCPTAELVPGEYILLSLIGDKAHSFKFIKKH